MRLGSVVSCRLMQTVIRNVDPLSCSRIGNSTEVGSILEVSKELASIEVKWLENPSRQYARHLRIFMDAHRDSTCRNYMVSC